MKVFVLKEEVDVVAVCATYEGALALAKELDLFNFDIEEFTLRGKK